MESQWFYNHAYMNQQTFMSGPDPFLYQRPGNAVSDGAGLANRAAAGDGSNDVIPFQCVRSGQRLLHQRHAEVVVSATNAAVPTLHSAHLSREAIICDISVPASIHPNTEEEAAEGQRPGERQP